jgi:NADH-quinone oxidoreductase subunit L
VLLWAVGMTAAVLTATYAFRPVFTGLTRLGRPRPSLGGLFTNIPIVFLALASFAVAPLVEPIMGFLGGHAPHAPHAVELVGAAAPFLGIALAAALTFIPGLSLRVSRARRMRSGIRIDGIYQVVFVQPFGRMVRFLTGQRGGLADPVGAVPVLIAQRLTEAAVRPLAHDPLDRGWMGFGAGMVRAWSGGRRVQSGRTRDYALALALGLAILLIIAWGTTWR